MVEERVQRKTDSKMRHEGCLCIGQKMRPVKFTVFESENVCEDMRREGGLLGQLQGFFRLARDRL